MNKKYYWLKLKNDFFTQPKIKKLRRIAGGDTYTCIYLKLMLMSLNNEGIIEFKGIESTLEAELSLILDEEETNISVTLSYLFSQNLLIQFKNKSEMKLTELDNLIGSETTTAERMRKSRAKKRAICNNVTPQLQTVTQR